MKAKDLVVGKTYICDEYPNRPITYIGVKTEGLFEGEYDFEAPVATMDYQGAICDDEQLEKYREIKTGELS